jgi:hypothetical protein
MSWMDLLQTGEETVTFPWVGGRSIRSEQRTWMIDGKLPPEYGWYTFKINARKASLQAPAGGVQDQLKQVVHGFLVGDRIVSDNMIVDPDPKNIVNGSEQVFLLEDGLDRFARVSAGRMFEDGPLIFKSQEFPLGPEDDVLKAFLDKAKSVDGVKGVTPALDAAFRMEVFQRAEADKRRAELEKFRREEEERRAKEERRKLLVQKLGDAVGRREMAAVDFETAAKHALAIGNAEYLDHRKATRKGEFVVRFRVDKRRFECVCDVRLHIIDSGICLVDHATGEKGDGRFHLESLPSVIREAERKRKLVVYRHVDD